MTLRKLILALTFIAVFAMGLRISIDSDSWWHISTGDLIREQRSVPLTDPFSYTREGQDWHYPSAAWLSQVGMSFIFERAGYGGLNLLVAATVMLALVFVYLTLSGGAFTRSFHLLLAGATSAVFWAARPHLATYLFFAIFLYLLEKVRQGEPRKLWCLPVLMLFWVNSHPGFAAGFILFFAYLGGLMLEFLAGNWRELRGQWAAKIKASGLGMWLLILLLMVLAVCVNPSGPVMLRYPFETLSIGLLRDFIQEWQSPNFHDNANLPFLFTILYGLLLLGISKRRLSFTDGLLLLVFGSMAFLAGRNIALFALASAPLLSRQASALFEEWHSKGLKPLILDNQPNKMQIVLNSSILILALVAFAAKATQVLPTSVNEKAIAARNPQEAVDSLLAENLDGRLFNSYNFGGYLIWALPDYPVFIDGRTDLYADGLLEEWLEIIVAKEGWQSSLDEWQIEVVLIEDTWPLAIALESEGWDKIYNDNIANLYIKSH